MIIENNTDERKVTSGKLACDTGRNTSSQVCTELGLVVLLAVVVQLLGQMEDRTFVGRKALHISTVLPAIVCGVGDGCSLVKPRGRRLLLLI